MRVIDIPSPHCDTVRKQARPDVLSEPFRFAFSPIDLVEAILRLVAMPSATAKPLIGDADLDPALHLIYNVGNNNPVELRRFVEVIEEAEGIKAVHRLPAMQPGGVPETSADVERLLRVTGFPPSTPLEAAMARFVECFRKFRRGGR